MSELAETDDGLDDGGEELKMREKGVDGGDYGGGACERVRVA